MLSSSVRSRLLSSASRRCLSSVAQVQSLRIPQKMAPLDDHAQQHSLPPHSQPEGLLHPLFCPLTHASRVLQQLRAKKSPLDKYVFLNGLKGRDPSLFYTILLKNMTEIIPILYTPTVGDACLSYSEIWRRPEGIYLSLGHKGRIREILSQWPGRETARIAVVTDGSRILGLGDLGANGLPISLGKLDLYIAGAGIRPSSTVPICLDLGTDNQTLLEDPMYLGLRRKRGTDAESKEFMDEFMEAMKETFPQLVVQFEDFATPRAFAYLDMYRDKYRSFNDDIQGTGSVILSGFYNAARLSTAASGLPPTEHKILFYGAGSAGIGVAKQLLSFFTLQGLSEEEAKARIWTVDSKGLICAKDGLAEHKKYFARTDYNGPPLTNLVDIINYVKPTALLGLSTIKGAFTQEVVERMSALNARPIIFPLSNPVKLCELDFEDAIKWSNGKVIFASGSPYQPVTYGGKRYEPGQGNNMYIFPGLGLGSILSGATKVTDKMVERAALALANSLTPEETELQLTYPRLPRIREVSALIARDVIRTAQEEGIDTAEELRSMNDDDLLSHVKSKMWAPGNKSSSRL